PRQRYHSVEAFAEQLRRFLAHEPTEWEEGSYLTRAVLARRRNPAVARAGLGVAALFAAAIYLGLNVRAAERRLVDARAAIQDVEQRRAQLEHEGLLTKQRLDETSVALARNVTDA